MSEPPPYPGTPRWVKVIVIVVVVLVLLFGGLKLLGVGGEHGPGRHIQSGDAGGQGSPYSVVGNRASSESGRG